MSAPTAATTTAASTTTPAAKASGSEESLLQHIKRSTLNCWASTISCSKNAKEKTVIKKIEYDIASRKKKFGVDYLNLKEASAPPEELQACLDTAMADLQVLKEQIQEKERAIGANQEELQRKIAANAAASTTTTTATAAAPATSTTATATTTAQAAPAAAAATTTTTAPVAAEPAVAAPPAAAATATTTNEPTAAT